MTIVKIVKTDKEAPARRALLITKNMVNKAKRKITEAEFEASISKIQKESNAVKLTVSMETDTDDTCASKDIEQVNTNTFNTNPNLLNKYTRTENTYTSEDNGTIFKVIFEKDFINEIAIGQLLRKLDFKCITEIKKTSKNRVIVSFSDKKEANKVINNVNINRLNLTKTYIPNSFVKSVGIVRDVPLDLSVEELMDTCRVHNGAKIEFIERMTFWDAESKCAKPSRNIKIEFRSLNLPEEMFVFYVRKKIEPFVPKPTICKKCLRLWSCCENLPFLRYLLYQLYFNNACIQYRM